MARHRRLGITCTGSMWCLTAGARLLHENTELLDAVARDIEGNPVEVPWQRDKVYQGTKTFFDCTNHPAFRAHNRERVCRAMQGSADGLHIDDPSATAEAAAENVRELGELGARTAGHPVLLSANANIPLKLHTYVLKYVTHIICEIHQYASHGTAKTGYAQRAFRMAEQYRRPAAFTAHGSDWAFIVKYGCTDLVIFWIALAYAHGQRFMVPHPRRQWCHTPELGSHLYAAPTEVFSPVYRFIRDHARLFDNFETRETDGFQIPRGVQCTVRSDGKTTVVHVVNTSWNSRALRMKTQQSVRIGIPRAALPANAQSCTAYAFDAAPRKLPLSRSGSTWWVTVEALTFWNLLVFRGRPA